MSDDEITEPTLKLCWNTHAIRRAAEVLRAAHLDLMAEDVEAQFPKPAVDEPEQFGSIVRAKSPQDPQADLLWTPTPRRRHYWMSVSGLCEVWSELTEVEVLRVGVGELPSKSQKAAQDNDAYLQGYGDFAAKVRRDLSALRAEAIGAERKDAYDKAIEVVESLS